jgi:hypothetical protein
MMLRFFRLFFAVLFCTSALIVVARQIGAIRASPLVALFTYPDGSSCKLPCMFGVRPGETKFDDVIPILEVHPLARNLNVRSGDRILKVSQTTQRQWIFVVKSADGLVDVIDLISKDPFDQSAVNLPVNARALPEAASIGDFISLFGSPDGVEISPALGTGRMPFGWYTYAIAATCEDPFTNQTFEARLKTNCLAYDIFVFRLTYCPPNITSRSFLAWHGFTTKQRYAQLSTFQAAFRPAGVPCLDSPSKK